ERFDSRFISGVAFRIHDCVLRGQIDNRSKGVVTGNVWVAGRDEPLVLELAGNACRDLAGCLLEFRNRAEAVADSQVDALAVTQQGTIGDLTASRKVRVCDIPIDDAYSMAKGGESALEHIANCLYIEWLRGVNGRTVIEAVD